MVMTEMSFARRLLIVQLDKPALVLPVGHVTRGMTASLYCVHFCCEFEGRMLRVGTNRFMNNGTSLST